ncbi:hypothetical protein [Flavobacterium sp. NKUCC04_CG]|uniref:hypothetical protein n=1 Tax=Flavobacterium sp. NKUCC04_CG TaxID=2842121 RepID=UPI001C5B1F10|nr:hypothetical protein [Flavobacterium sp. NKUCC04_CG]MBW3518905.1 hypothetical protein [Flavobacterium sp. NKUCC04_CG]
MKKFIFIASCLLFVCQSYAARIVEFSNQSSKTVVVYMIQVRNGSNALEHFWFYDKEVKIIIEPGEKYTLKHNNPGFQFPFYSTDPPPYIPFWNFYSPDTDYIFDIPSEDLASLPETPRYHYHGVKFWIGGIKGWGLRDRINDDAPHFQYTCSYTMLGYFNNTLQELIKWTD